MARYLAATSRLILRIALIVVFLAIWQGAVTLELVNRTIVPSPLNVGWKTVTLLVDPQIRQSFFITLQEIAIALGISLILGIPAGAAMAANRRFASLLSPVVGILLAAPMISFIPIIIMITGISMTSVIVVGVMASIALITMNTRTGVETIDPLLKTVARTFDHSRAATFWKLTLPGALPYVVVGARLAAGRAILGVVVGEFFAGTDGLAYRAAEFQNFLQTDAMYAAVVWLAAVGVAINLAATALEARLSTWRQT